MDSPSPKEIKGLKWEGSAIGTATWTGVLLRDVLLAAGIDANGSGDGNEPEIKHIRFEGYDEDISGSTYGASIPISKAMDPRGDVLLAFEMNGKELTRDHGYPLRVLVPGVAACRSVKWLKSIEAHAEESTSFWQQNDYKSFSPNVDWDNVDWTSSPAIQNMPVTSAITEPAPGRVHEVPRDGDDDLRVPVKGYAWSGGGNGIVRVDVSVDGGSTWQDATLRKIAQQPAGAGRGPCGSATSRFQRGIKVLSMSLQRPRTSPATRNRSEPIRSGTFVASAATRGLAYSWTSSTSPTYATYATYATYVMLT